MKRNFGVNIVHPDGTVVTEQTQVNGQVVARPINVRSVVSNALLARGRNEDLGGEEQVRRYQLVKRICAGDPVDITAEEAALIKKQVATHYTPLATGFIADLLDTDPSTAERHKG